MQIVLGISEGAWVEICVILLPLILGVFFTLKAKSDKSDIMVDVKKEIDEKIETIEKRMNRHDEDFKDFKREEIEPMKKDIHSLITKQSVIDVKIDSVIDSQLDLKDSITDLKSLMVKFIDKLDTKRDK